jgi:hypothetical protein
VFTIGLFCWAVSLLAGCLTTIHINAVQPNTQVRVLPADRERVWAALLELLDERNIQIVDSNHDQGWVRTDFVYFLPMDFGEPVLAGRMILGNYLDVQGGRYRLTIQLTPAGSRTSVQVTADVQRLEQHAAGTPPAEPSFSLDSPTQRNYLVQVPQPSNGVIERHFLVDVERAIGGDDPAPVPPRSSNRAGRAADRYVTGQGASGVVRLGVR